MALLKKIELDEGIIVNYHRIVSIINIINSASLIEIASYTSKTKRESEKKALDSGESMNIFTKRTDVNKEYTKDLNIDTAYEYLKTLDMFNKCTDDL